MASHNGTTASSSAVEPLGYGAFEVRDRNRGLDVGANCIGGKTFLRSKIADLLKRSAPAFFFC